MKTNSSKATAPRDPVYVALPKAGELCSWSGFSRSTLNDLILPNDRNGGDPPVKSICNKRKGAKRGARRILLSSLRAYLKTIEQQPDAAKAA